MLKNSRIISLLVGAAALALLGIACVLPRELLGAVCGP
jgi:hypothetical protein